MASWSYILNSFQATSGFTSDDGRLSDGVTTTGNGWESTGSATAGSQTAVTTLIDLGASPPSVTQAQFTAAWEGHPNIILDYSNDLSMWTTANTITSPDGTGAFTAHSYMVTISPSVTARYWRLSVQDTTAGGAFSGG